MGQKINPNIYQLGRTKIWPSKYYEKKLTEASKYNFKDIEANKFILKFFKNYNISVNNCKISYSENNLFIFISYFTFFEKEQLEEDNVSKKRFFNRKKKRVAKKRHTSFKKVIEKKNKNLFRLFVKTFIRKKKVLKVKQFLEKKNKAFTKSLEKLRKEIEYKKTRKERLNFKLSKKFLNKLLVNLSFFFKEKRKILLTFCPLNSFPEKSFSEKELDFIEKNLDKLKLFNKNSFLNKGLQVVLLVLKHNKTADFLAEYISTEIEKHKKQHFFLNFIEKAFEVFNKKGFCTPKKIKISIKGRFNGVPRSKKRVIIVGSPIAIISADTKVYYSQKTSFLDEGTFGVKVWISEKLISISKQNVARPKKN